MLKQITRVTETTSYVELSPKQPGSQKPSHVLTVHDKYCGGSNRPQINLIGNWLCDAGFDPGDKVKVTVAENQLVIEKLAETLVAE